jgi:hypothetical protein
MPSSSVACSRPYVDVSGFAPCLISVRWVGQAFSTPWLLSDRSRLVGPRSYGDTDSAHSSPHV